MTARGRGGIRATLVALAAMLLQALGPASVMAAEASAASEIVLCTPEGLTAVAVDPDGSPRGAFAGLPCADCLGAVVAAPPSPDLQSAPVRYAQAAEPPPPLAQPHALAAIPPPRPPSRAPPV